ncbi:MAG: adenylate/guanylate cyclase domain-containing protein [Puia sp.]
MIQSRQLAAIMFTDIVGYTALMGNNEQKAFELLLRKNREIQKPIIEEFGGQWIKELGDGVMASFPTVSDAVYAAIRIQQACLVSNDFLLRIGIHQGEVVFENGDIFGDAVNIASRLQALAPPAGIFVSESVHRNISNKNDIRSEFIRVENLRNVKDPVPIYNIHSATEAKTQTIGGKPLLKSILPDFDCDIYISYRFNDNKYDGWVTEFVDKLTQELSATLKDKLSIYFDKNPEEDRKPFYAENSLIPRQIKSLIFIPIIRKHIAIRVHWYGTKNSRASRLVQKTDQFGPNIKLTAGNTASRIIPVKIHDIDPDDIKIAGDGIVG